MSGWREILVTNVVRSLICIDKLMAQGAGRKAQGKSCFLIPLRLPVVKIVPYNRPALSPFIYVLAIWENLFLKSRTSLTSP